MTDIWSEISTDEDWQRMARVLAEVQGERRRQIEKWGGRAGDGVENPGTSNYVRLRTLAEDDELGFPRDGVALGDQSMGLEL